MRKYESIVVFSPELNKGQLSEQISKVKEILTNAGGVQGDIYVEEWGKRKIAYTVRKQTMGYYVCFYFVYVKLECPDYESNNTRINEDLNYNLRINDSILKFQTHFVSDKPAKYRGNMVFVNLAKSNEMIAPDVEGLNIPDLNVNE